MDSLSHTASSLEVVRRELIRKVRQVGIAGAIQHAATKLRRDLLSFVSPQQVTSDVFDLQHGTDTALIVPVGALDIPSDKLEHTNRYEAVMPQVFDPMLQELTIAHEDFVFIDIGSGKGRALLLAARYPFKRIIGVEISASLTKIAVNNIRMFKGGLQKCSQIDAVCSDALSYDLPNENTVLYFNNPFDEPVMRAVLANIERSVRRSPRKMYVFYQRPLHRELWDQSTGFRLMKVAQRYVLYEALGTSMEPRINAE